MPDWPLTLPQRPLIQGFSRTPGPAVLRSAMEVGPEKVRQRTTAVADPMACTFRMTSAQLATFETFYKTTLGYGVERFDMPDPITGSTITVRMVGGSGSPPYNVTYANPDRYNVAITFEVMP